MEDPQLSPWDVLGYGAFETTGFVTALLVSAYSFIPDPTGASTEGVSEIRTYTHWRRGILLVGVDLLFKATVLVLQAVHRRRLRTIGWLFGLMLAPWAPYARTVVAAVAATTSVRNLMIDRVARNEIMAVLRDFLLFGHHSLTIPPVARWVCGDEWTLPIDELNNLLPRGSNDRETILRMLHDKWVAQPELWLVTVRSWRRGPFSQKRYQRLTLLRWKLDVLRRRWTPHETDVTVDPFPAGLFSSPASDPCPSSIVSFAGEITTATRCFRQLDEMNRRTCVLDAIDDCHGGSTLSEGRCAWSLPGKFCRRCKTAVRGAVEAFLESSSRAHADVQPDAWLDAVTMDWGNSMEPVMDTLWVTVFVDHTALRVEDRGRPDGDTPSDVTVGEIARTKKLLLFLFLVARSLFAECPQLERVVDYIKAQLHSESWWKSYWTQLVDVIDVCKLNGAEQDKTKEIERAKEVVLWQMRNEDLVALLHCLVARQESPSTTADAVLCGEGTCSLHSNTDVVVHWRTDPLPRPPRLQAPDASLTRASPGHGVP